MKAFRYSTVLLVCLPLLALLCMPARAATGTTGGQVIPRFEQPITNIPGKSLIAVEVDYPPGGKTPAHHHAKSAFIMGYVISGAIRSKVAGQPEKVYHAGETFYEKPGADHMISANASASKPAKLLAVFVVDTDHGPLTTLDKQPIATTP